jgi:ATP-dependent protease HslVU (ClpYQ) peptidase subunit
MSTITVVRRENEVAIAADSLSSAKYWRREGAQYIVNHQKIFQIGESLVALSGATSAKLAVQEYFANCEETPVLDSVEAIYRVWLKLHEALKSDYFLRPNEDNDDCFESTRMDVLIANSSGIFGVAAHRSVQEFSKFFAFGSGDDYALGALFVAYEDASKSAEEVARLGVAAAIEFSSNSAAPILSHSISLKSC